MPPTNNNPYRTLPSIDSLLQHFAITALIEMAGRTLVITTCREVLAHEREQIRAGALPLSLDDIIEDVRDQILTHITPSLREVINATGVIVHTNLGRAPLSDAALAAMQGIGGRYSTLEWNVATGKRGSRYDHVGALLAEITGAESAVVVNNAAAALVLVLSALASGREAVMSRAHLIEIGGGFRIPDIMRQSGVVLREVGTTNRTYIRDYSEAATEQTALFMRMHSSNFRIEGFVHQPTLQELTTAAHERNLIVVDDVGSGALLDTSAYGLAHEPMVQESVAAGADLVIFSGDKLLGGPQAGCIVGRTAIIQQLRQHPLIRALRVDKTTLAGLDATLRVYQQDRATTDIPVWRMIATSSEVMRETATQWVEIIQSQGIPAEVREGYSTVGGGSLPGESLKTWLVALPSASPDGLAARLRACTPIVVGRIEDDTVLLDPRTVLPDQYDALLQGITQSYIPDSRKLGRVDIVNATK